MAKKFMVPDKVWAKYKNIITRFISEDAGLQKITWLKHIQFPLPFGEDGGEKDNYEPIEIEVLINYNAFRTWPVNIATPSGEVDQMNCAILISSDSLKKLNYLDMNGYWVLDPILDRFIINGKKYIPKGDTEVSQAKDSPILFQVILKRDEDGNN